MRDTRVLVAHASKHGSTAEIAEAVGETLGREGLEVDVVPAGRVKDIGPYRAVVLGSAVYMTRWQKDGVRFLKRFRRQLAERSVWVFQSGPLNDSADEKLTVEPPPRVAKLASAIDARGIVQFGGRLREETPGFVAGAMAKKGMSGDWRNWDRIHAWGRGIAHELAEEAPGIARPA